MLDCCFWLDIEPGVSRTFWYTQIKAPFGLGETVLGKVGRILIEMSAAYLQEGRYAVTVRNLLYIWVCKHTNDELSLTLFLEMSGLRFHIYIYHINKYSI